MCQGACCPQRAALRGVAVSPAGGLAPRERGTMGTTSAHARHGGLDGRREGPRPCSSPAATGLLAPQGRGGSSGPGLPPAVAASQQVTQSWALLNGWNAADQLS
mmetsp:Transcript_55241/g.126305  ORF Transcript_55241/g.126305 Transcript_55241/m.126305 type:complete len:104 (+) Transcript_55241:473-784(+)